MTRIKDIKNNKTYYITYDANKCGQPTKMWLKGKEQNLLWEDKNLIQIGEHIKYSYNTEGIRTKKETEEGTTEYSLIGSKIMKMEKVTSSGKITMYFTYDQRDELQSVTESNKEYYYIKDITGNIIKIKDEEGNSIVEYKYDAYGKVEKTIIENNNVSKYNPFIYKGYYYDEETELYYCNTRYYSPEIGRWISIDDVDYLDPESISGLNLYCYCMNDPVNYSDGSGHSPEWLQGLAIGLAVVGAVLVIGAVTVLTCGVGTLAGTMAGALIYGAAQGIAIGATVGVIGGGIVGGIASDWSAEGILIGMGIGLGAGAIVGGVIGGFAGASSFTANSAYISQYGGNVKEVLSTYKGNPKLKVLNSNTTVYRTWGGASGQYGHWISPKNYGSAARSMLSLPPGNTAANTSTFVISESSKVLSGKAAALFGQAGGGIQWWIGLL